MEGIGQLFIHGVSGVRLTDGEKKFLKEAQVGGIIFFKHNYESPAQIAELINDIQATRTGLPLYISVDQEGGRVIRFKAPFMQLPAMFKLGEINSPKLTYELHAHVAQEFVACGVNLNFSPCADILRDITSNAIGDRAFGYDPEIISKHVTAVVRGLQTNKVMACAKHFPGHGATSKDSHFDLPYIKISEQELFEKELVPFEKAVKARVEFVMMAHLVVDCIDEENPCSLSPKAYQLLRNKLKFKKIIISDDMEMKALTNKYSMAEAATLALAAGADMLCYRTMEKAQEAYAGVCAAAKEGRISAAELEKKMKRVMNSKKSNLLPYEPIYVPTIQNKIGNETAKSLMKIIEEKTQ